MLINVLIYARKISKEINIKLQLRYGDVKLIVLLSFHCLIMSQEFVKQIVMMNKKELRMVKMVRVRMVKKF